MCANQRSSNNDHPISASARETHLRSRPRSLAGKRAIITGASSGIGRALALALDRHSVRLVLVARRKQQLFKLADEIRRQRGLDPNRDGLDIEQLQRPFAGTTYCMRTRPDEADLVIVVGDITQFTIRDTAVAVAEQRLGGLDMLVNNAGISAHGRFAEASPERLRQIMEVNFFAAAELTRTAVPMLQRGDQPVVVNVGSILGRRGVPHNVEYCASKFALAGFSEAIRPELARLGIDMLLVTPGTTDTEFFDHLLEKSDTPWPEQKGVPAEVVARAIVRALQRNKSEIVPNTRGRALLWLNRVAPRVVDRILRRYG